MDGISEIIKSVNNKLKLPGDFTFYYIKKVIYNGPATVVYWSDGTKTQCLCGKEDTYDQEKSLLICIFRKLYPLKKTNKLFDMWTNNNEEGVVTIKDVRKKDKKDGK